MALTVAAPRAVTLSVTLVTPAIARRWAALRATVTVVESPAPSVKRTVRRIAFGALWCLRARGVKVSVSVP